MIDGACIDGQICGLVFSGDVYAGAGVDLGVVVDVDCDGVGGCDASVSGGAGLSGDGDVDAVENVSEVEP